MGYVDSNLLPGEVVTYRAKLHWMVFFDAILLGTFGLFSLIAGVVSGKDLVAFAVVFTILFFAFGIAFAITRWMRYISSEFAITDKRVLIKVGLFRRKTVELLLSKVETIGVDQGILGRLMNFGTITVTGTGGTKEPFSGIADPLEFRRQVQARLVG